MLFEQLVTTHFSDDPVMDAALASALVRRAGRDPNAVGLVRMYTPARTLSFGRLDTVRTHFPAAAAAARRHGFTPVIRGAGGRAAAYHEETLVLEMISPGSEGIDGALPRFERIGLMIADVLRRLGIDARVGPVPGEYCPGDWTINGAGRVKLAGTAQRVVSGAWLFGAELVVSQPETVREVLTDVNALLEVQFDPNTAASLSDMNPNVTLQEVQTGILAEIGELREVEIAPDLLQEAHALRAVHAVRKDGAAPGL